MGVNLSDITTSNKYICLDDIIISSNLNIGHGGSSGQSGSGEGNGNGNGGWGNGNGGGSVGYVGDGGYHHDG